MVGDLRADRAQEQPSETVPPPRADHHQVGALGRFEDDLGSSTLSDVTLQGDVRVGPSTAAICDATEASASPGSPADRLIASARNPSYTFSSEGLSPLGSFWLRACRYAASLKPGRCQACTTRRTAPRIRASWAAQASAFEELSDPSMPTTTTGRRSGTISDGPWLSAEASVAPTHPHLLDEYRAQVGTRKGPSLGGPPRRT